MKSNRPRSLCPLTRGFLILCLLLAGSAFPKDEPDTAKPSSLDRFLQLYAYFPFPFESDEQTHFLLRGKIGDQKVRLLVDTGAAHTTIDPRNAPEAKTLGELKTKLQDSLLGELTDPSILLIDNLSFGPARFFHQPAQAEKLESNYVQLPFDGILGLDFLVRNFCIIDCAGNRIYFRGSKPTPEQAQGIEKSLQNSGYAPVRLGGTLRLIVPAKVKGESTDWILDTGSDVTFLEESERKRLKLRQEQKTETGSFLPTALEGQVIGLQRIGLGDHHITVAPLPKLTMGSKTWTDVYVGLVDLKMSELREPEPLGPNVHGFLGAEFLRSHGALIDFSSMTLWFPPEPKNRR